jgi:hypothetical protein
VSISGKTSNIFNDNPYPKTRRMAIKITMPMRWLMMADIKCIRGNNSEGKTVFVIMLDCSNTAIGERFTTSAKKSQGNIPTISQMAKLVPPYSGPSLTFKITEKIK